MLIDRYRKQMKRYFWWEKLIAEEVAIAKKERAERRRHSKNSVGIDDPTGGFVAHKNMPIRKVTIYVRGKKVTIEDPEVLLDVIRDTYAMYSRQPIANLVQERIATRKSIEVISGFMGISKETYHRWEQEFFTDAIFLAANAGLYHEKISS